MTGYDQSDFSQELRLSSPADRALRFTAGLYYYRGKDHEYRDDKVISQPVEAFSNIYGLGLMANTVLPNSTLDYEDVRNTGVFGGLEWDFNEQWTATLEGRWARDEIDLLVFEPGNFASIDSQNGGEFDSFNPRLTLGYRRNEDENLYLNIAKGNKPGAFNDQVPLGPSGQPDESFRAVDEETAWNYEVGYKARLMDRRMSLNVAAFTTDVTDQQFTTVIETASGSSTSLLANLGETKVSGLEVEIEALVSENLTVNFGYAWTNAEIKKHIDTDTADLRGANGSLSDRARLGSVGRPQGAADSRACRLAGGALSRPHHG